MKKKLFSSMIIVLTLLLIISGCGNTKNAEKQENNQEATGNQQKEETTKSVVDVSGKEVELPIEVNKVVNTWPSSATMMISLGAGDKLVGVHKYVKTLAFNELIYPKLEEIPAVESNPEELLHLTPDVIVDINEENIANYNKAGLKGVNLMFNDYETMKKSLSILGDVLGGEYKEKTTDLEAYIDSNLQKVHDAFEDLKDEEKPMVYYAVGSMYSTTGAGTIMEQWVQNGGGKFATSDLGKGMQVEVTAEDILKKNPDIIVVSGGIGSEEVVNGFKTSPEWSEINAVKNNEIFVIPAGSFSWDRFGAESALQILWAANTFHPDLFHIDMKEETRNFYKKYANFDITDQQLVQLLNGEVVH
ncbi:ABC transporter substrate-binding protein [Cytobacillus solani]|uniref:ABC transporter substrate-binding protein n=1 Tax=Cytobacillus solani TaxID=1637975 RepID=UPI00207A048C|nr:ABC transporter substrate-binding protein [Cytobacillus solani]USK53738.1 ABC transporter substrate-binding protein [Cytobacillus solani]